MTGAIQEMLGLNWVDGHIAEAWWGAHVRGPSRTGRLFGVTLDTLIHKDPIAALGPHVARDFDGQLPYLMKILAIAKPLSIQVHPDVAQAREGFARENDADVPDGERSFQDPSHKPEMVVAVTAMKVLAGFRPADELASDLERLGGVAHELAAALARGGISAYVESCLTDDHADALVAVAAHASEGEALGAARRAALHFPGDPGALVALAMNPLELAPGDALYVPARQVHSYQSGIGVEIMANSDNVIRGGLTSKRVDVPLVMRLADLDSSAPQLVGTSASAGSHLLEPGAAEFALTVVRSGEGIVPAGPRIALTLAGAASLRTGSGERANLKSGDAVFVPASDGDLRVSTGGVVFVARVPAAVHP